ncbi:DUF1795 domain-containing protein [Stigmatella aurantiaca]|uniref:DUF1795 domain-containing protein n=1 Tax=Stigmatella aurantiaca (strain DW4/3-1) TaxID=378806 RepID=Q08WV5_STIAD|nr:DUF1795 domain-containing protein [Stigmatella aurantiaca]ADO70897.1 uncharacterized protein STAUR_3105 [Stigmatella aurantiaca DW4/3-1]EAU64954.1 hypothetical protein STIAU_4427 [Stigmatella aurantiaca DW4/3-1]
MTTPNLIKHGALRLSLPEGWLDASQVVAVGPEERGFRPNLVVSIEPLRPGETLAQFTQRSLVHLRRLEGFSLAEERAATFGPHQGVLREYTFRIQGVLMAQYQFQILQNSVGYSFTYCQLPEKMAATRAVAEQFFATAQVSANPELAVSRVNTVLGARW